MDRTKLTLLSVAVFVAALAAAAGVYWMKPSQTGEIVVPAIGARR